MVVVSGLPGTVYTVNDVTRTIDKRCFALVETGARITGPVSVADIPLGDIAQAVAHPDDVARETKQDISMVLQLAGLIFYKRK